MYNMYIYIYNMYIYNLYIYIYKLEIGGQLKAGAYVDFEGLQGLVKVQT